MKLFKACSGPLATLFFITSAVRLAAAHSWVEQLMRIASNGTMVGAPGYMRGYVPRSISGFSDSMDDYLLPPNGRSTGNTILSTDSLCHPSQTSSNYSSGFPMLSAAAGDFIALRYQENGHVSLPDVNPTKPLNRGTVYIYGTTEPASDELFLDVFQKWTSDGTGGNGRGRLLATRNFDDGQCYQVNSGNISETRQVEFKKEAENPQGSDLWCQNDIQLPSDLTTDSKYTLYWVWSWPTFNKAGSPTDVESPGFNVTLLQYYTSCMDVAVVSSDSSSSSNTTSNSSKSLADTNNFASSFIHGQDLNSAAVLDQLEAGSFQVSVPGSGNTTASSTGNTTATSTGSSTGSTGTSTKAPSQAGTTGTASAGTATGAATGDHTVFVTVIKTQAPIYITVTAPAGGSNTTSSSSKSKSGRKTHTLTTYSTTFVTETLEPSNANAGATATTGATTTASTSTPTKGSSSSSGTPAATVSEFVPTPGQTLTVQPFLSTPSAARNGTMTTLLRVRRHW